MSSYPLNQFVPVGQGGVNQPPPDKVGWEARPYDYVLPGALGTLTALQALQGSISLDTDADWLMLGWYVSTATGAFQIKLEDDTGYNLQSGYLNSGAISTDPAEPTVFSPSHPFHAGGQILIYIQDLSDAGNVIQIVFKGMKLYRAK